MLLSKRKKFIFYHIYKTAGSSLRRALLPYCSVNQSILQAMDHVIAQTTNKFRLGPLYQYHPNLQNVKEFLGDNYEYYFKFCFVRDPLDWQKSIYFFTVQNPRHHQHTIIRDLSFEDYILWRLDNRITTQSSLISDSNGILLVNQVYRMEELNSAVSAIEERLQIKLNVPHVNKSKRNTPATLSNDSLQSFVNAFREDYKNFGYPLPQGVILNTKPK